MFDEVHQIFGEEFTINVAASMKEKSCNEQGKGSPKSSQPEILKSVLRLQYSNLLRFLGI